MEGTENGGTFSGEILIIVSKGCPASATLSANCSMKPQLSSRPVFTFPHCAEAPLIPPYPDPAPLLVSPHTVVVPPLQGDPNSAQRGPQLSALPELRLTQVYYRFSLSALLGFSNQAHVLIFFFINVNKGYLESDTIGFFYIHSYTFRFIFFNPLMFH